MYIKSTYLWYILYTDRPVRKGVRHLSYKLTQQPRTKLGTMVEMTQRHEINANLGGVTISEMFLK